MVLSYDGSGYLGWQRLGGTKKNKSIQSLIEHVLQEVFGLKQIKIIGSGRTDAGVHAKGQVANFYVPSSFLIKKENLKLWQEECNKKLPMDIRIKSFELVDKDFHSRFSARSKTYVYTIDQREVPSVFTRKHALWVEGLLNLEEMKACSRVLLGEHDFRGFSSEKRKDKDTIRRIDEISFVEKGEQLEIAISGNGFLYNMVRIIVGTLLEVGQGERTIEQVRYALQHPERKYTGMTVSSHGLCLEKVEY